jgi:hypothetical protein
MMRTIILSAMCLLAACASATTQPANPTLTLDHIWIATPTNAPAERAALEQAGFRISPNVNRHDGQGTASHTVEFENGYLELIYADESVPITSEGGRIGHQRFVERGNWRETNVSPFGLAVRRTPSTPETFPFETWRVTADWMAEGTYMEMLTPRGSRATSVAVHAHGTDEAANLRAIAAGGAHAWPFLHPNGARRITNLVVIAADDGGLPPSTAFVNESGAASLHAGSEWLAILTLDDGRQGQRRDVRPALPLVIHY